MDISSIKTATLLSGPATPRNDHYPYRYKDRQKRYYDDETSRYIEEVAKYSNDFVEAEIQGLVPERPFEYRKAHIRLSNIINASGTTTSDIDDYKQILVAEREYSYLRKGAKVKAMGSIWLVINPDNMASGGKAVIQRCDATWRYLDWYGNICSEPMCVGRLLMRANDADSQRSSMITKGYFDVKMQYNRATADLSTNSRLILGSSAYRVTGYSDFAQEFTDDDNSVDMIEFSIRYEEPNDAIDDMENRVAGGKTFDWEITIGGKPSMKAGETTTLTAASRRNDEDADGDSRHPVSYIWKSSNEEVATVDRDGNVTAIADGSATITCKLKQNPNKQRNFAINVESTLAPNRVEFKTTPPETLAMLESVTLTAAYFEGGEETGTIVEWELSNAREAAYKAEINGNSITIKCFGGSEEPLAVKASCNGERAETVIYLQGI